MAHMTEHTRLLVLQVFYYLEVHCFACMAAFIWALSSPEAAWAMCRSLEDSDDLMGRQNIRCDLSHRML